MCTWDVARHDFYQVIANKLQYYEEYLHSHTLALCDKASSSPYSQVSISNTQTTDHSLI